MTAVLQDFSDDLPKISETLEAQDGTVKFQVEFSDGEKVETVLIPFAKRFTVCLSTQVGCAMKCSFCYTGTQGLKRNLQASEIVGQFLVAKFWLKNHYPDLPTPSIVFMGQGEPLHNFESLKQAIEILIHPKLGEVGPRQITLSTAGFLPKIPRIQELAPVNIALSFHSPFTEERDELIPINKQYPLIDVLKALETLPRLKRQFITIEYLMIKNFNMQDRHVHEMDKLLSPLPVIINLIPFNPYPGSVYERPSDEEINHFRNKLVEKKLRVMLRTTKGDDILAACGQLKILKDKNVVR